MKERIINCFPNLEEYSIDITRHLCKMLKDKGFTPYEGYNENAELNIAIGGDGSFLHAVRKTNFSSIPYVGINTGTLGFFPEIMPSNMRDFIKRYKNNDFKINEINLIECVIDYKDKSEKIYAVNDIAIKRIDMKTIHLNTYIDSNYLQTISGDGLIVSSPLGSSAYNYSAGGALVYPSLKTLQITPLSPLISNAYRCLNTSIVVPPEFEVKLVPEYKNDFNISLVADGYIYEIEKVNSIIFYTSKKTINQLSIGKYNYWNVIKEKFL